MSGIMSINDIKNINNIEIKMTTLRQLEYLIAIDEIRHFHKAAHKVGVTQPTLSAQIKLLEENLGVVLIERSRTSVFLTEAGQRVVLLAKRIINDVQEIYETAETMSREFAGTIRLGVSPTIGPYLLPHVIPGLHKAHKDLKLYVREVIPAYMPNDLINGKYDLLLTTTPVMGAGIHSLPLFREPLYLAVPADSSLAEFKQVERKHLKGQSILTLETGHQLHKQVVSICEEFGAKLLSDYEGTSLDTIRQMVGMGMGVSFLPGLYVKSELRKEKSVILRELKGRKLYRTIGVAWRENTLKQKEYETLANYKREAIKQKFTEFMIIE